MYGGAASAGLSVRVRVTPSSCPNNSSACSSSRAFLSSNVLLSDCRQSLYQGIPPSHLVFLHDSRPDGRTLPKAGARAVHALGAGARQLVHNFLVGQCCFLFANRQAVCLNNTHPTTLPSSPYGLRRTGRGGRLIGEDARLPAIEARANRRIAAGRDEKHVTNCRSSGIAVRLERACP